MAAAATAVRFHTAAARRAAPRRAARFAVRADAAQTATALTQDDLKRLAAVRAVEQVESGMVLGLGTGSTAAFAVAEIGALLANGKLSKIVGVPTSKRTYEQALSLGIPLSTLDDHPVIDLAIDGADEVLPLALLLFFLPLSIKSLHCLLRYLVDGRKRRVHARNFCPTSFRHGA
jgi:ribose 5-phosphate isomerase A